MQPPLHEVSPALHIVTHWLASQTCPGPHTRPQAPQLFTSVASATHLFPQATKPGPQRHWLLTHVEPTPPHALPHAPQLFGSAWVKVHAPLHSAWLGKHAAWQAKPVHTWPIWQTTPHAPQLLGSVRATHWFPQRMVWAGHWQTELVQVPPAHELPHPPQFAGSLVVLVHSPLHTP
jgi:hypothetical protein